MQKSSKAYTQHIWFMRNNKTIVNILWQSHVWQDQTVESVKPWIKADFIGTSLVLLLGSRFLFLLHEVSPNLCRTVDLIRVMHSRRNQKPGQIQVGFLWWGKHFLRTRSPHRNFAGRIVTHPESGQNVQTNQIKRKIDIHHGTNQKQISGCVGILKEPSRRCVHSSDASCTRR